MNCAGERCPCSGWCQRNSTSAPITRPERASTCGCRCQFEFLSLQGLAQFAFQLKAGAGGLLHGPAEQLDGVAPGILGAVKGDIGALEQIGRTVAVVRHQCDADARRHLQPVAFEHHGFGQQHAQLFSDLAHVARHCRAFACQAGEQHDELVTAQACHGVFLAGAGFEPCGDHLQYRIANRMAERVVDVLEVVEVEKQQRAAQVVPLVQRGLLVQSVHQQGAVRQVGQRVVVGQVLDLRMGSL